MGSQHEFTPLDKLHYQHPWELSTAEVLSIVLGSGGPHQIELAERVVDTYSSLQEILNTTPFDLQNLEGIGLVQSGRVLASVELGRRLFEIGPRKDIKITSPADAANMVIPSMSHLSQEELRVMHLTARGTLQGIHVVAKGRKNGMYIGLNEVFREAIRRNATAVIAVHNHPSGDPTPSVEDISMTKEMVAAGKLLNVPILDHLVIGQNRFTSLRERGLGFNSHV